MNLLSILSELHNQRDYEKKINPYTKLERLIIGGSVILDQFNQKGIVCIDNFENPKSYHESIHNIMTEQEFVDYMKEIYDVDDINIRYKYGNRIFTNGEKCSCCNHELEFKDISNFHTLSEETELDIFKFNGMTLEDVLYILNSNKKGFFYYQPDYVLRNDRFVSESNLKGWASFIDSEHNHKIDYSYIVSLSDKITVNITRFYHHKCFTRMELEKNHIFNMICFNKAGYNPHSFEINEFSITYFLNNNKFIDISYERFYHPNRRTIIKGDEKLMYFN